MTTGPRGSEVALTTRASVVAFLGPSVVWGLVGVEAWPLTGWRLSGALRGPAGAGWRAATVDGAGAERGILVDELPRGRSGGLHARADLGSAARGARREVWRAWAWAVAVEVERLGAGAVQAVRVHRAAWSVGDGPRRSLPPVAVDWGRLLGGRVVGR